MGFFGELWNVIRAPFKGVGQLLGDVAGPTLGSFGADFGKNIPTTFSLDVEFKNKIEIEVALPDVVLAARQIRDGLANFDIFRNSFAYISGGMEELARSRRLLGEFQYIATSGTAESPTDTFLIQVSLVNTTPSIAAGSVDGPLAECCFSASMNNAPVLASIILRASPQSSFRASTEGALERREVFLSNMRWKDFNTILFGVTPSPFDANGSGLKLCRLHAQLLRKTANVEYVLIDWVFEGNSGPSSATYQIPLGHGRWAAMPIPSQRSIALAAAAKEAAASLYEMPPGQTPGSALSAIVAGISARGAAYRKVEDLVNSIADDNPNTIDIRAPITAVVVCHSGIVEARADVAMLDEEAFFLSGPTTTAGDRIGGRVPLLLGQEISADARKGPTPASVRFALSTPSQAVCTFGVYAGIAPFVRSLHEHAVSLRSGDPLTYSVPLLLADSLADNFHG